MKLAELTDQEQKEIESMKSMMDSCFCYGSIDKDSYQFERYILPYKKILGEILFSITYHNHKSNLELNYKVERLTGQDGEGNWYNTLTRK